MCEPCHLAAFQEGVGSLHPNGDERPLAQLSATSKVLHQGASPALGGHHDGDSPNPLQRGLADCIGTGVRQPWFSAD